MSFVQDLDQLVYSSKNGCVAAHLSWTRVRGKEAFTVISGLAYQSQYFSQSSGEPLLRIRDILRSFTRTFYDGPSLDGPYAEPGDIVIGMDGDFNCRVWTGERALLNQRVCKVVPNKELISSRLLAYALPGYLDVVHQNTSAITVKHLSTKTLGDLPLALPPRAEQERIADRLDELFSDIEAGEKALDRARTLIGRYRQSVLKAAVTGELTRDWRGKNLAHLKAEKKTGADLLADILTKRREAWETAELAKMRAKGQEPRDDRWKARYKEPAGPDAVDLHVLPEGWVWASLDQLLTDIEAGKSFGCEERPPRIDEVGIVKVSAVTWGVFDENESKTITDPERVDPRFRIHKGDFLFSRANTIELVGASVIVGEFEMQLLLSDKILRFIFAMDLKSWIDRVLKSTIGRRQIEALATGNQHSMRNITQESIRQIAIPLPPLAEIHRVVELVDAEWSKTESAAAAIVTEKTRSAVLRQSVLTAAFSGRLVSQRIDDEPVSEMLARIRVRPERGQENPLCAKPSRTSGRPAVPASDFTKQTSLFD